MITQHLLNVFTSKQLENIVKILNFIKNQPHKTYEKVYTNGFTENDSVYPLIKRWVIDPINDVSKVKIKKINVGMKLISRNPFPIHSDSAGKKDAGRGQAYLIPLSQSPVDKEKPMQQSHTIIFDQTWMDTQSMEDYIKSNPPMPTQNADSIWEMHCDHNPREWLRYLSLKMLAPWTPGSVITWDRKLLHTSDNFLKKNMLEKTALVIFATDE